MSAKRTRAAQQTGRDTAGRDLAITITIGTDGRLLFHDLTPDLLPVAAALCPTDPALIRRLRASQQWQQQP